MLTFYLTLIFAISVNSLYISGPTTKPGFTRGQGHKEDLTNGMVSGYTLIARNTLWNLWYQLLLACYSYDTNFLGDNMANVKVPTIRDCQILCQETEGCNYFVYALPSFKYSAPANVCFMKTSITGTRTEHFMVSGTKHC